MASEVTLPLFESYFRVRFRRAVRGHVQFWRDDQSAFGAAALEIDSEVRNPPICRHKQLAPVPPAPPSHLHSVSLRQRLIICPRLAFLSRVPPPPRRYGPSIEFLKALSRGCLRKEPSRRPTALDALACLQHHIGCVGWCRPGNAVF